MKNGLKVSIFSGIVIVGILPVILYWIFFNRASAINPEEAREVLSASSSSALLVDVREKNDFDKSHIEGSVNWPYDKIMKLSSPDELPSTVKNHDLFLVSDAGFRSSRASQKLKNLTGNDIYTVHGGIQKWVEGTAGGEGKYFTMRTGKRYLKPFPVKSASIYEQIVACASAFFIKPLYMIFAFIIIWTLRKQTSSDIKLIKWAMIFFLAGESFCALNYLIFHEDSFLVEYFHIIGMVAAFGTTTYAVIKFFDLRLIQLTNSNRKCAALTLCKECIKYTQTSCGFTNILIIITSALIAGSFFPLMAGMHMDSYNTSIFGAYYNYAHPLIFQYFENRYAPFVSILFFCIALFLFFRKDGALHNFGIILFSAGFAFLGFSLFRLVIFSAYRDNLLWFIAWEEITELLYVFGTGAMIWTFRERLLESEV